MLRVPRHSRERALSSLRPMMRTTSMFELAYTNSVAGHLLWNMGSFTSCNFANQRLYRQKGRQQPRPITPPRTGALPALIRDSRRQPTIDAMLALAARPAGAQGTIRSSRKRPSRRTNIASLSTTSWKP